MSFKSFTAEKKSNKLKLNIARTVDLEKILTEISESLKLSAFILFSLIQMKMF